MNIDAVAYNGLSCMEGSPGFENSCDFQFGVQAHYGFVARQLLEKYPKSERSEICESINFTMEVRDILKTLTLTNLAAFKPEPHNLYFSLNNGFLNVNYIDGTVQTIENPYQAGVWSDYRDLWTYNKNCRVYMHQKAYFLWLTLLDIDREDVNIRVMKLKRAGDIPASYSTTLSTENILFICGQNFNFNGNRYDEYGFDEASPKQRAVFSSHIQQFRNVTDLSFSTESCASLVLIEKRQD